MAFACCCVRGDEFDRHQCYFSFTFCFIVCLKHLAPSLFKVRHPQHFFDILVFMEKKYSFEAFEKNTVTFIFQPKSGDDGDRRSIGIGRRGGTRKARGEGLEGGRRKTKKCCVIFLKSFLYFFTFAFFFLP